VGILIAPKLAGLGPKSPFPHCIAHAMFRALSNDWRHDAFAPVGDGLPSCRRWLWQLGVEPRWACLHAAFGKPTLKKHSPHPAKREVMRNDCGPVGSLDSNRRINHSRVILAFVVYGCRYSTCERPFSSKSPSNKSARSFS